MLAQQQRFSADLLPLRLVVLQSRATGQVRAAVAEAREQTNSSSPALDVEIDNLTDPGRTVIRLSGETRADLLHTLTGAFSALELIVNSASIRSSLKGQVHDIFKVTDPDGNKARSLNCESTAIAGCTLVQQSLHCNISAYRRSRSVLYTWLGGVYLCTHPTQIMTHLGFNACHDCRSASTDLMPSGKLCTMPVRHPARAACLPFTASRLRRRPSCGRSRWVALRWGAWACHAPGICKDRLVDQVTLKSHT